MRRRVFTRGGGRGRAIEALDPSLVKVKGRWKP